MFGKKSAAAADLVPFDVDPEFDVPKPSRKARRTAARQEKAEQKAAAAAQKQADADAKKAAKVAAIEAKKADKVARVEGKKAAKLAAADAKKAEKVAKVEAKRTAKLDAAQAKEDAKLARAEAKSAAKQAKADAKAAAKAAKKAPRLERELEADPEFGEPKVTRRARRAAAKAAKAEQKAAAVAQKKADAEAKKTAKLDAAQAKKDAKLAEAQAKKDAKLARAEEKKAAKAAKKAPKADQQLEADPEFGEPKLSRKDRAAAKKAAKVAAADAKKAAKIAKAEEKKAAKAAKKAPKADPQLEADPEFGEPKLSRKARAAAKKAAKAKLKVTKKAPKAKKAKKIRGTKQGEIVGLKVGASQIAAARIVNNGDRELVQVVREPLAPGIVTGGEVRDPAALGDALAGFFTRHKLPRKGVRLGLANSRIGVRVIEIAGIDDDKQLANAIGFRAHETLSIPLDEAVLDWHELSQEVDETGSVTRRILLVAVYRDSVDRYLAATDHAGIELAGIDLEAFALLRALAQPAPEDAVSTNAAIVVVSVGHERTTLAISDGRVCEFTRVLEWGGSEVTNAIARALKISPLEAAELKHGLSFEDVAPAPLGEGLPGSRPEQAVDAARFELQTLVRELLSSLRFYQAQPGSLAIGEILVSGGMAEMPGFTEELERQLGVRTRLADPLGRVSLGRSLDRPEKVGSLAVAIGLGIED